MFIIGTVIILFGAYYVTYYVGLKASGQTRAGFKNRNIRLLDRYAISRDKQFCVLEVAGKVYIIGIANHSMTLLDTFDAAAFAKLTEDNQVTTPWNETPVGQYGNRITKKVVAFIAEKTGRAPLGGGSPGESRFEASLEKAQRDSDEKSDESEPGKLGETKAGQEDSKHPEED